MRLTAAIVPLVVVLPIMLTATEAGAFQVDPPAPTTRQQLYERALNASSTADGGDVQVAESSRAPQGQGSGAAYDPNAVGADGLTNAQRYGVCIAVQQVAAAEDGAGLDAAPCNGTTPLAPVDVALLARARLRLPLPTVQAWPPTEREVVGIRAWFHVDTFAPASANAAAGTLSATVSARPTQVVWRLGETTLTCTSAGALWQPGLPDDATDCGYVFQRYTEGRTIDATVDVTYQLTWTANTGDGGDLGIVTRTSTFPLRVWEIQALIN